MKNVIEYVKKVIGLVKTWAQTMGIDGLGGGILGIVLWILGYKIYAGFALGIFASKNMDIIKKYISDKFLKNE